MVSKAKISEKRMYKEGTPCYNRAVDPAAVQGFGSSSFVHLCPKDWKPTILIAEVPGDKD